MRRAGLAVPVLLLFQLLLPGRASALPGSITSVRRDVVVTQALPGRVVAVFADVRIAARVSGDVVVWGGNVSFAPGGSVAGDLLVFGGAIEGPSGVALPVEGRVSTPGSLLQIYLSEMRRAPWEGAGAGSPRGSPWPSDSCTSSRRRSRGPRCPPRRTGRARCWPARSAC